MRLGRRVATIERRLGVCGPCRLCRGVGRNALVDEAAGQAAADARGCPACGRVSKVIVLGGERPAPGKAG